MKIGCIILSSSFDLVPGIAVCDPVIQIGHIPGRTVQVGRISIFAAYKLKPGIVGMKLHPSIPGIIYHFVPSMKIGRHNKMVNGIIMYESQGLHLPHVSVRMRAGLRIREVTVQIDSVCIVPLCTIYRVVSAVIGSVRIG